MEVTVEKLRQTLKLLKPAVAKQHKALLPATEGILLADGHARSTDMEVAITVQLLEVGDERLVLPYLATSTILAHLAGDQTASISPVNGVVHFRCGQVEAKLVPPGEVADFLPIATITEQEQKVDGDVLLTGLEGVKHYVTANDARRELQGICITLGEPIEVAAADGFRLAWQTVPVTLEGNGHIDAIIVPSNAVSVLAKLWDAADKPPTVPGRRRVGERAAGPSMDLARGAMAKREMFITFNTQSIKINFGTVTMVSRLIQGTFPKIHGLIPEKAAHTVMVDARAFLQALKMVTPIANDSNNIIRLTWSMKEMSLTAQGEDASSITATIPATATDEVSIGFNARYLLAYFDGKQGPVTLETTTRHSAGLFRCDGTPHVLIMPMFLD